MFNCWASILFSLGPLPPELLAAKMLVFEACQNPEKVQLGLV